tara:strand:+ start:69 stop:890 length:822 start_codon:yes stop_codon:yes gene_type:complete
MKISLIVTTYNSPKFLIASLTSLMEQTILPDEILIADDGSKIETKNEINSFRIKYPKITIKHIWQKDEGFRAGKIRNHAIQNAKNDYIVQIDGDIICHPKFIEDHCSIAEKGHFLCGLKANISEKQTKNLLSKQKTKNIFTKAIVTKNSFKKNIRIKLLSNLFTRVHHKSSIKGVFGCNFSYWKKDAIEINGYDENIQGWGKEDNDFISRLQSNGIKRKTLLFAALEKHLFHIENSRENVFSNEKKYLSSIKENKIYCEKGINESQDNYKIFL